MSIAHHILGIQLLKNLTLKIQGQGQKWGQSWKSQCGSDIQSTHIHFVPCESGMSFLSCDFFKICPWKSRAKVMRQVTSKSQGESKILSTHIPFVPCQSGIPFLSYDSFKIWPWKSSVKVMGEVTLQSHNVGLTSYRLTSFLFHVNRASHSSAMTFSKFDLENLRSRSWVRSHFKVKMGV